MTDIKAVLTDGTGISAFTRSKVFKDFVVDFLLGVPAGLAAVGVGAIPTDKATAVVATLAVGTSLVKSVYRAVLSWAQTPTP